MSAVDLATQNLAEMDAFVERAMKMGHEDRWRAGGVASSDGKPSRVRREQRIWRCLSPRDGLPSCDALIRVSSEARSISLNVPATMALGTTTQLPRVSELHRRPYITVKWYSLCTRGGTSLNTARSTGLSTARSTGGGPLSARSNTSTTSTYRRHQVYGAYQHPLPALSLAGSLRGLPASHASGSPRTMALDMARVTLDEVNNRLQFEDMGFDARSSGRREERKRIKKREKEAEEDAKNRRLFNAAKTLQRALKQRYLRRTLVERKQRKNAIIIQRACRAWLWRRYGDDYAAIVLEQYTARCGVLCRPRSVLSRDVDRDTGGGDQ